MLNPLAWCKSGIRGWKPQVRSICSGVAVVQLFPAAAAQRRNEQGAVRSLFHPGVQLQWQPANMAAEGLWQGQSGPGWSKLQQSAGCSAEALCLIRPILLSRRCLFPLWRSADLHWAARERESEEERENLYAHSCTQRYVSAHTYWYRDTWRTSHPHHTTAHSYTQTTCYVHIHFLANFILSTHNHFRQSQRSRS